LHPNKYFLNSKDTGDGESSQAIHPCNTDPGRPGVSLFSWLGSVAVSDQEVRSEIWRLGGRHLGFPLEGALKELNDPQIPRSRAELLRACVRKLQAS
jgi:hypothetical protein